jgi:hypothetical protein
MVPCRDGGLLPGDPPIDQSAQRSPHQSSYQSSHQSSQPFPSQIEALQSWLEQRLASLESMGAFEEAYALRMEMADWLLAEAS